MVIDYKYKPSLDTDYLTDTYGIVRKDYADTGKNTLGVYIPKLMMNLNDQTDIEIDIDTKANCLNSVDKSVGGDGVQLTNWVEVPVLTHYNMRPPLFVKGERVELKYIEKNITSLFVTGTSYGDEYFRAKDRVEIFAMASDKEKDTPTPSNTYRAVLDAVNQLISLSMSKKNGELGDYQLLLDGANGTISISDGTRKIGILTEDDIINIMNEGGSSIIMEAGKTSVKANDIDIVAENKISMKCSTFELESKTQTEKTKTYTLEADTYKASGKSSTTEYDMIKSDSKKMEAVSKAIVLDAPAVTATTELNTPKVVLGVASPGMPSPPSFPTLMTSVSSISGPASTPVCLATPLMPVLINMAAYLDVLAPMVGMPPTISAAVGAASPNMFSKGNMG